MEMRNRPLSPHLQIYKRQITSVLSILHRVTGILASLGAFVLVYWILALASGPVAYETAQGVLGSFLGQLILFGFSFATIFHMCTGIRHLFWDAGFGFDPADVEKTGKLTVAVAIGLTIFVWLIALI